MHYLITGGAGFIGSHLTEYYLKNNDQVTVIDNLSTGRMENIQSFIDNPNFTFIKDDLINSEDLPKLVKDADAIFHLAAMVGVDLVLQKPLQTMHTNIYTTERLLELATQENKRIIIASTSEVYGKSEKETFEEEDALLIGTPTKIRWCYATVKIVDEFLAMAHIQENKLPATIVRFFNVVGPRQVGNYGMVVPRLITQALQNTPLKVFGTGEQSRCFCHIHDVIKALVAIIAEPKTIGEIYNIGSTNEISINFLAKEIIRVTKSRSEITQIPYDQAYDQGFEDMTHRRPSIAKLNKTINWEPNLTLEDIIKDSAEYIKNNLL